jgi:high-affinity Fe2+/Pb2+ permease
MHFYKNRPLCFIASFIDIFLFVAFLFVFFLELCLHLFKIRFLSITNIRLFYYGSFPDTSLPDI